MKDFKVTMMDPKELNPHPSNFRRHPQSQVTQIKRSLDRFGWLQNVVWNKRTAHTLNGHARVELAIKRKELVPVHVIDVDEKMEKQILAALDKTGEGVQIDSEVLADLLKEIAEDTEEMPIGWSPKELEKLLAETAVDEDDEDDEEPDLELNSAPPVDVPAAAVRMVPLYLNTETEPRFRKMCEGISRSYGTSTVTDTVYKAVEAAWELVPDADLTPDEPVAA